MSCRAEVLTQFIAFMCIGYVLLIPVGMLYFTWSHLLAPVITFVGSSPATLRAMEPQLTDTQLTNCDPRSLTI